MRATAAAVAVAIGLSAGGCATVPTRVGYAPLDAEAGGMSAHTVVVVPSRRAQSNDEPVFTVTFVNAGPEPVVFGPDRVRAYFRGRPTPLASRAERIAQAQATARSDEAAADVAGLLLGVVAVGAALYGLANPSLVAVRPSRGGAPVTEVVRVADPTASIVVVAAAGGAAEVAAASSTGRAADVGRASPDAMLRATVVPPGQRVSGQVVLAGCCDAAPAPGDVVRIEVEVVPGDVRAFSFARVPADEAPLPPPSGVSTWPSAPAGGGGSVPVGPSGGQHAWSAERAARAQGCEPARAAVLSSKGPGVENWSVACAGGEAVAVRCEFGNCRALR